MIINEQLSISQIILLFKGFWLLCVHPPSPIFPSLPEKRNQMDESCQVSSNEISLFHPFFLNIKMHQKFFLKKTRTIVHVYLKCLWHAGSY